MSFSERVNYIILVSNKPNNFECNVIQGTFIKFKAPSLAQTFWDPCSFSESTACDCIFGAQSLLIFLQHFYLNVFIQFLTGQTRSEQTSLVDTQTMPLVLAHTQSHLEVNHRLMLHLLVLKQSLEQPEITMWWMYINRILWYHPHSRLMLAMKSQVS